ncbi:MAG: hypothetical protein HOV80_12050, partial [Polyangiaceae bacterium]|nr:hypothetical protein [Polyangiaceae bacterium]
RPERGEVRVAGRDPARDVGARRRIGTVGLSAALPAAASVSDAIAIARSAHGSSPSPQAVLDAVGLGALAGRKPETLTSAEARAVELAIALATEAPALLVVHEPFIDMARSSDETLAALEAVGKNATVIVLTSSPADARRFERVLVLARGFVARESTGAHPVLGAPPACHLVAWVASGARELAAALAGRTEVASLILSADAPGGLAVVRLAGTDMDALAAAFAEAAATTGADVEALREMAPVTVEVTAMTEWEVRARQLTAMHVAASDARLRAELAAADAAARAAAYAARGYATGHQQAPSDAANIAPAWGPAAPAENSPGVLAPAAEPPNAEPPNAEPPRGGEGKEGGQ